MTEASTEKNNTNIKKFNSIYTGSLLERDGGTLALAIKQKEGFLVNKLQTKQNTALLSKKGVPAKRDIAVRKRVLISSRDR